MTTPVPPDITQLLRAWDQGDQSALDKILSIAYPELHRIASSYMRRERQNHTLQPTALINEAYMKLVKYKNPPLNNRSHFFAICANTMRRILVDHAREKNAEKRREEKSTHVTLDEASESFEEKDVDLLALDDALTILAEDDPRAARVIELRLFVGFTIEETAEELKISIATVKQDWKKAKARLKRELSTK